MYDNDSSNTTDRGAQFEPEVQALQLHRRRCWWSKTVQVVSVSTAPDMITLDDDLEERAEMPCGHVIGEYACVIGEYACVIGEYACVIGEYACVIGEYACVIDEYARVIN